MLQGDSVNEEEGSEGRDEKVSIEVVSRNTNTIFISRHEEISRN